MQISFTPIKYTNYSAVTNAKHHTRSQFENNVDTVSFSARNFLAQPEDKIIATIIKSIKNEENCLGVGSEAEVFQIEGTDYCVRLPHSNIDEDTELISYFGDFNLQVNKEDKINHVVARLSNGATIMNKINGRPVFSIGMTPMGILDSIFAVSKLPQSAYCNLLNQIAAAYKEDMIFDPYGTNVIFDSQSMTAIDFYKRQSMYKEYTYPLNDIYDALVNIKEPPIGCEKVIIKKIYKAVLSELEPQKIPCLNPEEFDIYKFTLDLCKDKKINDKQFEKIWNSFNELIKYKESELAGIDVGTSLEDAITNARDVLDEVF